MNKLKSYFISLSILFYFSSVIWAVIEMLNQGWEVQPLIIGISSLLPLTFFSVLFIFKRLNTQLYRRAVTLGTILAFLIYLGLSSAAENLSLLCLAHVALVPTLWLLYNFWYSKSPKHISQFNNLNVNDWCFTDTQNRPFLPIQQKARFRLFVFHRGAWCPICSAQIRDMIGSYDALHKREVQVNFIVGGKPDHNASLAKKFGLDVNFLSDKDLSIIKKIGIFHDHALPFGLQVLGFKSDHARPTVILANQDGDVVHFDVFEDYRDRQSAEYFIELVDKFDSNFPRNP